MSYDFSLRVCTGLGKGGIDSDPRPRLARVRAILQAFESQIEFSTDTETGTFAGRSDELGEVEVGPDGIRLSMSMGSDPRSVYTAIHGLLRRFRDEPYEAFDPQIDGPVVYRENFAEFMRQYREQFSCSDEAFGRWCAGHDYAEDASQQASPEDAAARAAQAFPRSGDTLTWQERNAMSDAELWAHLQQVSARNNESIRQHALLEYMGMLSDEAKSDRSFRRLDGSYYPDALRTPWFQGSALHYEALVLGELLQRGFPAAVQSHPQRLVVEFDLAEGLPISNAHRDAVLGTLHPIIAALQTSGQVSSHGLSGQANCWRCELYGDDVDAIESAFQTLFSRLANTCLPTRMLKRRGGLGAPEVTVQLGHFGAGGLPVM